MSHSCCLCFRAQEKLFRQTLNWARAECKRNVSSRERTTASHCSLIRLVFCSGRCGHVGPHARSAGGDRPAHSLPGTQDTLARSHCPRILLPVRCFAAQRMTCLCVYAFQIMPMTALSSVSASNVLSSEQVRPPTAILNTTARTLTIRVLIVCVSGSCAQMLKLFTYVNSSEDARDSKSVDFPTEPRMPDLRKLPMFQLRFDQPLCASI